MEFGRSKSPLFSDNGNVDCEEKFDDVGNCDA